MAVSRYAHAKYNARAYTHAVLHREGAQISNLEEQFFKLYTSVLHQPTSIYIAHLQYVARSISWRKIWDHALDRGVRWTKLIQTLFKVMSTHLFGPQCCILCGEHVDQNKDHISVSHLNMSSYRGYDTELFVVAARVLSLLNVSLALWSRITTFELRKEMAVCGYWISISLRHSESWVATLTHGKPWVPRPSHLPCVRVWVPKTR